MSEPSIAHWLAAPLRPDVAESLARLSEAEDVRHIAVMPDVHLSGDVCVGVALATQRLIYPAAVGGDIGCGMAAVAVQAGADLLDDRSAGAVLAGLARRVPAMRHSRKTLPQLPEPLRQSPLSDPRLSKHLERDGRVQLGTLGRGNHFLEFQADQEQRLWIMLHSGSRAMGQAITVHHVAAARQRKSPPRQLPNLDAETAEGAAYLADVVWAVRYANESRLAMLRATEQLLTELFDVALDWATMIHADHNHVRRESHFGESLLVHRKGALPAAAGQPGVIPGSMGNASFHVTGRGCQQALSSSSHGAGRALSRSQAAQRIPPRQLLREMRGVWFDERLARQLCDEAPSAYKDVRTVMRAQRDLTRIDRELRPLLSYKGC